MAEKKLKHMDYVQNAIARMNSNSFLIKGWGITLVSALFALAAKDSNLRIVWIAFIVIPTFWLLDAFYLSQERQYRQLYNEVSARAEEDIDFKMDANRYNTGRCTWLRSIFSKTLLLFYGVCVVATGVVIFLFKNTG